MIGARSRYRGSMTSNIIGEILIVNEVTYLTAAGLPWENASSPLVGDKKGAKGTDDSNDMKVWTSFEQAADRAPRAAPAARPGALGCCSRDARE